MLYYATEYRFSNRGPSPASCSKEQDLLLCSCAWQLFICRTGWLNQTDRKKQAVKVNKKLQSWNTRRNKNQVREKESQAEGMFYSAFSSGLKIRSQLFSLLFDLRVHKPPSLNVPPPTPKTGKDFPSNFNPINAC